MIEVTKNVCPHNGHVSVIFREGIEYPYNPRGVCIFLKNNLCSIHKVKPYECSEYFHGKSKEDIKEYRKHIINEWGNNQTLIEKLLNRKPVVRDEQFSFFKNPYSGCTPATILKEGDKIYD